MGLPLSPKMIRALFGLVLPPCRWKESKEEFGDVYNIISSSSKIGDTVTWRNGETFFGATGVKLLSLNKPLLSSTCCSAEEALGECATLANTGLNGIVLVLVATGRIHILPRSCWEEEDDDDLGLTLPWWRWLGEWVPGIMRRILWFVEYFFLWTDGEWWQCRSQDFDRGRSLPCRWGCEFFLLVIAILLFGALFVMTVSVPIVVSVGFVFSEYDRSRGPPISASSFDDVMLDDWMARETFHC